MGKKNKSKDKLYFTNYELKNIFNKKNKNDNKIINLSFKICSLSLKPFNIPCCTKEGIIFDKDNILNYINKYHKNPITKEKFEENDLIYLNLFKNEKNDFICPISKKIFTDYSKICVIKKNGNVYDMDTIKELIINNNDWKDFLTGEEIKKSDIIELQNKNKIINLVDSQKIDNKIEEKIKDKKNKEIKNITLDKREILKTDKFKDLYNLKKEKPIWDENLKINNIYEFLDERIKLKDWKNDKLNNLNSKVSLTSTNYESNISYEKQIYNYTEMVENIGKIIKNKNLITNIIWYTSIGDLKINLFSNKVPKSVFSFLKILNELKGIKFKKNLNNKQLISNDNLFSNKKLEMMDKNEKSTHNKKGLISISNFGNLDTLGITLNDCTDFDDTNIILGEIWDNFEKIYELIYIKNQNFYLKLIDYKIITNPFDIISLKVRDEIIKNNKENNFYNIINKKVNLNKNNSNNSIKNQLFGY